MAIDTTSGPGLLERERDLSALDGAVARARAGRGGAVVVEGPAGIGKSSLLAYVRAEGERHGMRVVSARGAELERGFPFGVVRQFFTSFLFTVAPEDRHGWMRHTEEMSARMAPSARSAPADEFALLHSLYWMCVRIADERPLLMVLDDAQWADVPSLNFVEFACRRLEQLPLLFVVASRLADESSPASLVTLLADPAAEILRPALLSPDAVAQLVRERVGAAADPAFAEACHEVTGGNPFLLGELVHEVLEEKLPPTAASAARVHAIGPRGVARVVLLRLARLTPGARSLAAALSVAGEGLTLPELAGLSGLGDRDAAVAAAGLEGAEIIELRTEARFTHPVVRAAIYEDLPAAERARLHARAGRLLADAGRSASEIAAHLLHIPAGEDAWARQTLRAAARLAEAAGDLEAARRLLARALVEGPQAGERAELLAALGRVEARAGDLAGVAHLEQAAEAAPTIRQRTEIEVELANLLKFSGDAERTAQVLLNAAEAVSTELPDLRRRLDAELMSLRYVGAVQDPRFGQALDQLALPAGDPADTVDALSLAGAAWDRVTQLGSAAETIELARRALAGAAEHDPALGAQMFMVAMAALVWAEDFDFAHARMTDALARAHELGSPIAVGNYSGARAICAYRMGRLLESESDAAVVLELAPDVGGLQTLYVPAVASAVLAGIDRGTALDALHSLAFDPRHDRDRKMFLFPRLSYARGQLLLEREEWERALEQFRDCQRQHPSYGAQNPSIVPWREGAALALSRLGDEGAAREHAADAVDRARRFGAPRALGMAQRASALVGPRDQLIAGLTEAAATLGGANCPLELVRVQVDLGAALRAAGRRTDAQAVLEPAHRLAGSLGAVRLGERAAEELAAAGVRPKRELARGIAALTPSERRVAELAAGGKTNREIAQTLFVTEKTVETHLGHVYDKLGIRSRRRLPDALGAGA